MAFLVIGGPPQNINLILTGTEPCIVPVIKFTEPAAMKVMVFLFDVSRIFNYFVVNYTINRKSFRDTYGVEWEIGFEWLGHVYLDNIESVQEVNINSLDDVYDIVTLNGVSEIGKIRLMEKWRKW